MNLLFRMGDVQIAFKILTHCFMQQPSYILLYILPSSTFIESFIYFHYSSFQMFGHLLGLDSFDSPKGFLVCEQVFFPITFNGIEFTPTTTITPKPFLWSWTFVVSIIIVRFIVEQLATFLKP